LRDVLKALRAKKANQVWQALKDQKGILESKALKDPRVRRGKRGKRAIPEGTPLPCQQRRKNDVRKKPAGRETTHPGKGAYASVRPPLSVS
jgi:hypothetical protein